MIMDSLNEKYDDLVESVSVWYGFFRESGVEMSPSTSRVMSQLQNIVGENQYLRLIAYFVLIKELLSESHPDEVAVMGMFDHLLEDYGKDNLKFIFRFVANNLSNEQSVDLLNRFEDIHEKLHKLPSAIMMQLSEQINLVG